MYIPDTINYQGDVKLILGTVEEIRAAGNYADKGNETQEVKTSGSLVFVNKEECPKNVNVSYTNSFGSGVEGVPAHGAKQIVNDAIKEGYVSTLSGRRRYLRELHDSNYQTREYAKRAAMNAPIQGTAADLIKMSMIEVHKALKEGGYKTKMVLQIHDELIFKVPHEEKEQVYKLVKNVMENAMHLEIPFVVDGGFGKDWYEAK